LVRDNKRTGTALGEIARRILAGTPPERIPVGQVPSAAVFDWRQITRWGIDVSRLPAESEILFRTPTAWETYKWYIVGTMLVVTAQLLLIAGLLTQRARRRRAETTILSREVTLRSSYERIRQLTGRLITAQEATRANIAQDLHDDVCQQLAHISLDIESLKAVSGAVQDAAPQHALSELSGSTQRALGTIRRLSHDLHPATLRIVGLVPALKAHCSEVASRHHVQVVFTVNDDLGTIPVELALCLFRIAQESLRNGIVHGRATRLAVSLKRSDAEIEMSVSDNGQGFDRDAVSLHSSGLGLVSMEERAHAVGGALQIVTGIGKGTTIYVKGSVDARNSGQAANAALGGPTSSGEISVAREERSHLIH
jgi:signal transduction histidine kinase